MVPSRRVFRLNVGTLKARAVRRRPEIYLLLRAWIASCIRASLETGRALVGGDIMMLNILTCGLGKSVQLARLFSSPVKYVNKSL